ncbi:hypothetical protein ACPCSC_30695 [Streptomyces lavendulocolor]|uniref:hypothetical protein n=1 Tax=Streptomyces lavendulocolor TaxID=67316 RepID=UPI003C2FAE25
MTTVKAPASYGPMQLADRLDLARWQVERAQRLGLIPAADPKTGRWPAVVVDDVVARLDDIRAAVGTMPDVGAARAEEHLAKRFNLTVNPGTAAELARRGHLPVRGEYRGHALYCGLALETFKGREKVVRASGAGHLHMRDAAAKVLGIRDSDFDHLVRAGLLAPADYADSRWNRYDVVPLFRQADLRRLARSRRIDWAAVRATPKGSRSPLAALPTRKDRP